MKNFAFRYLLLLACGMLLLGLTSCSHKNELPEDDKTPQTLIVYMVGTELSWAYSTNASDIEKAIRKNIKGRSRVIIVRHSDEQTLRAVEIEYVNNKAKEEERTREKEFATYNLPTTMDTSTLGYIFSDITSRAEAQSYGLIIGSHGWGWVPFADYDTIDNNGGNKYISHRRQMELLPREYITRFLGEKTTPSNTFDIETLSDALSATGKKFDYILFDACFMSNIETVYELRDNAKFILASLCEIMGYGFPYQKIVPLLLQNGGRSYDLAEVAKCFNEHYKHVSEKKRYYSGSVAVINCAALDGLAEKMFQVNLSLSENLNINKLQSYDGGTNHIFFDLGDYVNQACTDEQSKTAFMQQLERCVVTKYTLDMFWSGYIHPDLYPVNREVFSGLTTSAPSRLCRQSYAQTAWYKATH